MTGCLDRTLRWRRPWLGTNSTVLAEESLAIRASPAELEAIHDLLDRFWTRMDNLLGQPPDQAWKLRFETAVGEIGANIARHAYGLGVAGPLRFRLRLYGDRVEGYFTDRGIAFVDSTEKRARPGDDLLNLPESGYGLSIARSALDRLAYRRTPRGTNSWRLIKRLPI